MTSGFRILDIVGDVGEVFTMSGVSKEVGPWGDAVETYTAYSLSGVAQVMDGTEELVSEGLLEQNDIACYVDDSLKDSDQIAVDNHVTFLSGVAAQGIYRVVNVVHNDGHYEFYAKRIKELSR